MIDLKITVLGDVGVGKTTIVSRFVRRSINPLCQHTIGVEVTITSLKFFDSMYRLKFYDMTGATGYETLYNQYIYNSSSIVVVYDISKYKTFVRAKRLIQRVYEMHTADFPIILIGNKIDEIPKRRVKMADALNYVKQFQNVFFVECSGRLGTNVHEALKVLVMESSRDVNILHASAVNNVSNSSINCIVM